MSRFVVVAISHSLPVVLSLKCFYVHLFHSSTRPHISEQPFVVRFRQHSWFELSCSVCRATFSVRTFLVRLSGNILGSNFLGSNFSAPKKVRNGRHSTDTGLFFVFPHIPCICALNAITGSIYPPCGRGGHKLFVGNFFSEGNGLRQNNVTLPLRHTRLMLVLNTRLP